jgi:hypothetical protein
MRFYQRPDRIILKPILGGLPIMRELLSSLKDGFSTIFFDDWFWPEGTFIISNSAWANIGQ